MSEPLRVFVNGVGVTVPQGSSVLDAIVAADAAIAAQVRAGTKAVADSRGIVGRTGHAAHRRVRDAGDLGSRRLRGIRIQLATIPTR